MSIRSDSRKSLSQFHDVGLLLAFEAKTNKFCPSAVLRTASPQPRHNQQDVLNVCTQLDTLRPVFSKATNFPSGEHSGIVTGPLALRWYVVLADISPFVDMVKLAANANTKSMFKCDQYITLYTRATNCSFITFLPQTTKLIIIVSHAAYSRADLISLYS